MNPNSDDEKSDNHSNDKRAQESLASNRKAILEVGTNVKNETLAPVSFPLGNKQYCQEKVTRTSPPSTNENATVAISSTANYSSSDFDFSEPLKDVPSNTKKMSSLGNTKTAAEPSLPLKEDDVQSTKSNGVRDSSGIAGNANQSTADVIQKIMKEKEIRSLSDVDGAVEGVGARSNNDPCIKDGIDSVGEPRQRNQQRQQFLREDQQLKESSAAYTSSTDPNKLQQTLQRNEHHPTESKHIYSTVEDILMHSTHSSSNSLVESTSDDVTASGRIAALSCAAVTENIANTPSSAVTTQSPSKSGTDTGREFPLPEAKRPRIEPDTYNQSQPTPSSSLSQLGIKHGECRRKMPANESDNTTSKEIVSLAKTDEGFEDGAFSSYGPSVKRKPKVEDHSTVNALASDGEIATGIVPVTTSTAASPSSEVKEEAHGSETNSAATIEEDEKKEDDSSRATTDLTRYSMRQHFGLKLPEQRWRAHQIAEDYISLASAITLPPTHLGPFGYSPSTGQYPIEQVTSLGYLTSPIRRPTVIEKWSPYEIVTFEAALALHGKVFHKVQKWVKTKNTKEIVEFYYIWKKTSHYQKWKRQYESEIEDEESSDDERKGGCMPIASRGRR
ncbi:hypothetical protein ACHAXS_006551 [Conticribra weissflogii]